MADKQWVEFNINDYVKVKITETGIDELKKQHEILKAMGFEGEFKIPEVDENGYVKFQMHRLMHTFGRLTSIGFECPFETTVLIGID